MHTTVERVAPGFRDYVGRGLPGEVVPWARELSARPDLELVYAPKPDPACPGWVVVRVRLRGDLQPTGATRRTTPTRRPAGDVATVWPRVALREQQPVAVRDWTPVVRPALIGGGGLLALGGVLWLAWQVVRGVAAAAAANMPLLILIGFCGLVVLALWLRWKWRRWRSSKACPGVQVHHCSRCPDH